MSADRWSECPKCRIEFNKETDRRIKKAADAYGKVDRAEYARLLACVDEKREMPHMLREDFSIGQVDGSFAVEYFARCEVCDFKYVFKTTRDMLTEESK